MKFNIGKDVHLVVSFLKINLSDKLYQDPPDRFSPNFLPYGRYLLDYRFDPLFPIAQGALS